MIFLNVPSRTVVFARYSTSYGLRKPDYQISYTQHILPSRSDLVSRITKAYSLRPGTRLRVYIPTAPWQAERSDLEYKHRLINVLRQVLFRNTTTFCVSHCAHTRIPYVKVSLHSLPKFHVLFHSYKRTMRPSNFLLSFPSLSIPVVLPFLPSYFLICFLLYTLLFAGCLTSCRLNKPPIFL